MKVAVVHDWLNTKDGGAERVLRDILELYPGADVFTLVYNKRKFADIAAHHQIKTSNLQRLLILRRHPQFLLPFIRGAVKRLDLTGYDVIVSSSGAWSKNVTVPNGAKHFCYCHSPARMLWVDWPAYLDNYDFTGFRLIPFLRLWITRVCSRLRVWDYYGASGVDRFIANSHYVAGRIKKFYHQSSAVVYPGIDTSVFEPLPATQTRDYFVMVTTLARYKNIDLAITTAKELRQRLVIVGDGPDRERLKKVAGNSQYVDFTGFVSESEKNRWLAGARAMLFTSIEDFGIAPIEAYAAGTPVIALKGGGLAETIEPEKNGLTFTEPTSASLIAAVRQFEHTTFQADQVSKTAQKFSRQAFHAHFKAAIHD